MSQAPDQPPAMTVEQARAEAQKIILPHVSFGRVSASAGGLIDEIAALLRRLPTPCTENDILDREEALSMAADGGAERVYDWLRKGVDVLTPDGETVIGKVFYREEDGDRSVGIPDQRWLELEPTPCARCGQGEGMRRALEEIAHHGCCGTCATIASKALTGAPTR